MSKQIPRSSEIDAATRQALIWLREYVDTTAGTGGGGGGTGSDANVDGGTASVAGSSYLNGGSA